MRLRTLTEDDYAKSLFLATDTIETETLSDSVFHMWNSTSNTIHSRVTNFHHNGIAIPTELSDIESIGIYREIWDDWGESVVGFDLITAVNIKAVEPFTAEFGFETKRIIGEFSFGGSIFDFHICIGFAYEQVNQIINKSIGHPLFGLIDGLRSSLFLSRRTGTANINFGTVKISGKNAVNIFPISEDGRLELREPLKPNERINAIVSYDISGNIPSFPSPVKIEFKPKSIATLAPIGYIDSELAADLSPRVLGFQAALINTLITVDENGASFRASLHNSSLSNYSIRDTEIDFSVHSVEIVEILE